MGKNKEFFNFKGKIPKISKCFQMTIMNSKIWQIKCHKHKSTKAEILADCPCFKSRPIILEILEFLNCCIYMSNCQDLNIPAKPRNQIKNIKCKQRSFMIIDTIRY